MTDAHIPRDQYAQLAKTFDPVDFNAEQWVKIAKEAGMEKIFRNWRSQWKGVVSGDGEFAITWDKWRA